MALTDPTDTLAFHMSRPLTAHRNMSDVPCSEVAKRLAEFRSKDINHNTKPEREALWFYGMNHGMALISSQYAPYEPLPEEVVDFVNYYHSAVGPKAVRAFYYLLIICTREARHLPNKANVKSKLVKMYGQGAADYLGVVPDDASKSMEIFIQNPPKCTIGQFSGMLTTMFNAPESGWSGSFGGPNWGNVSDCMWRFVRGEFTAEMMLDTNWTLSHNGGPIFNKGMFYAMYDSSTLAKLLDVQRSGQIPEMLMHGDLPSAYLDQELISWMKWMKKFFPGKIGDYVDWFQVEALGSLHNYPAEQSVQTQKYGVSPKASELQKQAVLKAAKAAELAAMSAKEKKEKFFEIMPGMVVEKIKIKRAA